MRLCFHPALVLIAIFSLLQSAVSQQAPTTGQQVVLVQGVLTAPNATPFHLKATITEGREQDPVAHVEMVWLGPNKWRRTIEGEEFTQTLIVNEGKVYEKDSDDYMPLGLSTLLSAMLDPGPIITAHQPGDILLTKANGASDESGRTCYPGKPTFCGMGRFGLSEEIGTPGFRVTYTDYRRFKDKRIARQVDFNVAAGEFLRLNVDELKEAKGGDGGLFAIASPTGKDEQIRSVQLTEAALRAQGTSTPEIIWPQVLDGATTGKASFYVVVDRNGAVREVLPVRTANERSNDSARRQLMRWKFKPVVQDGSAVQAGSVLVFKLNTRAWGPAEPLSNADARKLAEHKVEPIYPSGTPAGTTYNISVAVDSDGKIIEEIMGEGPAQLMRPCMEALAKWEFKPILENGEPRPYRAKLTFVAQ